VKQEPGIEQEGTAVAEARERRATDFERVEMLAVALDAFAQPVPDYEPRLPPRIIALIRPAKR